MTELANLAERLGNALKKSGETVAIAESSAGGLVSAALLAVPGASAYFLGGAVIYTRVAKTNLLAIPEAALEEFRSASEGHALVLARAARERLGATWGIAETGAAGPFGNRYGDASGHTCVAVAGPSEAVKTIETGDSDRAANMDVFAEAALALAQEIINGQ